MRSTDSHLVQWPRRRGSDHVERVGLLPTRHDVSEALGAQIDAIHGNDNVPNLEIGIGCCAAGDDPRYTV